ncbi:MAG TPA: GreA/GreB family elongation factor [Sphingobacteriaceae bacterium]
METNQIILSRGIYQLVKTHIKQNNRLSESNKNQLETELKSAKVVNGKSFPDEIVGVNRSVTVRDMETDQEFKFDLVDPAKAKMKNNKLSVLSPIGLALVGYGVGSEVQWEMADGTKKYRIEEVSILK